MLSQNTVNKLLQVLVSSAIGNEIVEAVNNSESMVAQTGVIIPALVVATTADTTTDFSMLLVGDNVLHIPASSGSVTMQTVAIAATLPTAAVVGDFYIVFRAWTAPASV